jgi:short-subunit dehydrogenase
MTNLNILITGASSGIGKELATVYANKGVSLYLVARNMERLLEIEKICKNKGANVVVKSLDVTNKIEIKDWINTLDVDFDIVFANAGVSGGTSNGFEDDEKLYQILETNIFGVVNTITPIVPKMIKRRNGRIVIISSMASFRGLATQPAYSASKACVRYYGESLNNSLKKYGINVNVVCPGFIKTPLTDKNHFYMPFIINTNEAVKKIQHGIRRNKKIIIFPKILYYAIKFLSSLPFGLDDFIYSKLPEK